MVTAAQVALLELLRAVANARLERDDNDGVTLRLERAVWLELAAFRANEDDNGPGHRGPDPVRRLGNG